MSGALVEGVARGWLVIAALLAARVAPAALTGAMFGGAQAPWLVRLSVALVLALALLPGAGGEALEAAQVPWPEVAALGLKELALGATVALLGSMVLWAAQMGGGLMDRARGAEGGGQGPLARLHGGLALAIFLSSGSHLWLMSAFGRSLASRPLLAMPIDGRQGLLLAAAVLGAEAVALAVALAAPALASALVAEVLLAVWRRAGRRVQAASMGWGLREALVVVAALAALHGVVSVVPAAALGIWRLLEGP